MKIWLYLLFTCILSIAYVSLFILPGHMANLALIPEKVHQGEFWRFFTYPFVHVDFQHLLKNLIGLSIITIGIIELKTKFSDFSSIYLLAGFLAVLPIWFIIQFTALGASVAIYSIFGLIALESKKYEINPWHMLVLLTAVIVAEASTSSVSTSALSSLSHFSGLVFGVFSFFFAKRVHGAMDQKKIHCLRRI